MSCCREWILLISSVSHIFSWLGWIWAPNSLLFIFLRPKSLQFLPFTFRWGALNLLYACMVRTQPDLWAGRTWVFPFKFSLSPMTVVTLDSVLWFPRPKKSWFFQPCLVLCVRYWACPQARREAGNWSVYSVLTPSCVLRLLTGIYFSSPSCASI